MCPNAFQTAQTSQVELSRDTNQPAVATQSATAPSTAVPMAGATVPNTIWLYRQSYFKDGQVPWKNEGNLKANVSNCGQKGFPSVGMYAGDTAQEFTT